MKIFFIVIMVFILTAIIITACLIIRQTKEIHDYEAEQEAIKKAKELAKLKKDNQEIGMKEFQQTISTIYKKFKFDPDSLTNYEKIILQDVGIITAETSN